MKRMAFIQCGLLIFLFTILMVSGCLTVSERQPNIQGTNSIPALGKAKIAVLPVKTQTSLSPDSVMPLRNELNKRLGTTLHSKLPTSFITDMTVVAEKLSQSGELSTFEQLLSTYENTGVIDRRLSSALGRTLGCNYLLLSRLKAEKMDLGISRGMGASLEVMIVKAITAEVVWGGSGEWKRGGILGTGYTGADEAAENLIQLTFDSLQSSGDAPEMEMTSMPPVREEDNKAKITEPVPVPKIENVPVAEIQRLLLRKGYKIGSADGKMGKKTIDALKKFQQENNLPVTGQADPETINKLMQ